MTIDQNLQVRADFESCAGAFESVAYIYTYIHIYIYIVPEFSVLRRPDTVGLPGQKVKCSGPLQVTTVTNCKQKPCEQAMSLQPLAANFGTHAASSCTLSN